MMNDDELKAARAELAEHLANHRSSPEIKLLLRLAADHLDAREKPKGPVEELFDEQETGPK